MNKLANNHTYNGPCFRFHITNLFCSRSKETSLPEPMASAQRIYSKFIKIKIKFYTPSLQTAAEPALCCVQ